MAFIKHEGVINTLDKFLVEIKKYLLQSTMFDNAVDFGTLPKVVFDGADIGFSIKHKDGKWFNFGIKRSRASAGNILSISISRDGKASRFFYDRFDSILSEYYPATTECGKYLFPFVNLYVTTTKTFVAFSAEVKKGQFVHFVVGKHRAYDDDNGVDGEFVYATFMPDGLNPSYDTMSVGFDKERVGRVVDAYQFLGQTRWKSYMERSNSYLRSRTVLYDGVPSRNWSADVPLPSQVIYYGLACPINIPLDISAHDGLIEMYDIQHVNITYGSSKYNSRSVMNPHHLRLNVATGADKNVASVLDSSIASEITKNADVFYNNEMCTLAIEDIEPATIMGDWVIFPLVTKNRDGIFEYLWSSNIGVGFKFK